MPSLDDRRAAPRGVGATDRRRQLEARLVEEDEVGPPLPKLLEDAGELLGPSVGDPLFIPLPGLLLRPLAAPAQPPSEELADVLDVILDAEAATDELGDPAGVPKVVGPAVGPGALQQQSLQLPKLLVGKPRAGGGMGPGGQGLGRLLGQDEPAIQRGAADSQDAGDDGGRLPPPHQLDRVATATFQLLGGSDGSHALTTTAAARVFL